MTITDLNKTEYDEYTAYYMNLVPAGPFEVEFEKSKQNVIRFFKSIPAEKHDYSYAENKWTIKDVLQHMIDVERIFAYRALRFARKDTVALPGFDENNYGSAADTTHRKLEDLIEEFDISRSSTQGLFQSFTEEMLTRSGVACKHVISVRAIGFKFIGHDIHHCAIIKERYL